MTKYAILDENTVVAIETMDEESYLQKVRKHQLIIDIENLVIQPQVGWILVGNKLAPAPGQEITLKTMIKSKIRYYQDSAPELLRDLYAENTLLGLTTSQSDQMFEDYSDVLIRIREGAWPTALYRLGQKEPSGFVTQQMQDNWTALITSRM